MKTTIVALLLSTLCLTTAAYGDQRAGFMTTSVVLDTGPAEITVWYPSSNKNHEPSNYLIGPFVLAAGATRDAPIKGGKHPLIIINHGGGGSRLDYFPTNELLAAEGYVVVAPTRPFPDPLDVQAPLLSSLITHMLYFHALRDSIDPDKIGALGFSKGGFGVATLAAGDGFNNPPDSRVRGIIVDEGLVFCEGAPTTVSQDCMSVSIPALLRDGSPLVITSEPLDYSPGSPTVVLDTFEVGNMAPQFAALENAFPRYLVTLDNPAHLGFGTAICSFVELARLDSRTYQHEVLGVPIPELQDPRELSYFFEAFPVEFGGNGDAAGQFASLFWNFDVIAGQGLGSAGDFCGPEYGGPATPGLGTVMENQTMIETLHATDLGFWQTVFGNGQSDNSKLEKAVEKLDSVKSFVKVSE